jgi:hypothetical protein
MNMNKLTSPNRCLWAGRRNGTTYSKSHHQTTDPLAVNRHRSFWHDDYSKFHDKDVSLRGTSQWIPSSVGTDTVGRKRGSGLWRVSGIALFTFEVRHTNLVPTRQPICRASLTVQYQGAANLTPCALYFRPLESLYTCNARLFVSKPRRNFKQYFCAVLRTPQ